MLPEPTAGIERVLAGIVDTTPADDRRLERGAELFDALYAALGERSDADGPPVRGTGG